jgi:predicted Rossmann fold nucleotide-binding protein DprA/Smf involved in DNA uptake
MQRLALADTPGLGRTKARRVIEFFGSVQALSPTSLTELEAAGLRTVSAQALGTGGSTRREIGGDMGDVWDELPTGLRLTLQPESTDESHAGQPASLLGEAELSPHEKKIFALLKADEATHIDEIVERRKPALSFSGILAALLELELAGKLKQLRGRNFVKSF